MNIYPRTFLYTLGSQDYSRIAGWAPSHIGCIIRADHDTFMRTARVPLAAFKLIEPKARRPCGFTISY